MEKEFRELCKARGLNDKAIGDAVVAVREFEQHLNDRGSSMDSATVEDLKQYISLLMSQGRNSRERLLALARYSYLAKMNDMYIYFTSILGGRDVLANLSARMSSIAGEKLARDILSNIEAPPLGSPPESFPPVTQRLMESLEAKLSPEMCRQVLAGNMHGIPREAFNEHRELFKKASTIDEFLTEWHRKSVAELENLLAEGRLFYEQKITPRVVEFVKQNQEVLGGVRQGNNIYLTKIPYAPDDYLDESDPKMKRYYACHCPWARASILEGESNISSTWCYCSGGYQKLIFDVVFDEPVEVELLESALAGDSRCRFAVRIPDGKFK